MTDTDRILLLYLALVNFSAFFIFRYDKRQARSGGPRVPERFLLRLGYFGGALGALLAIRIFRHKTRHRKFRILVPLAGLFWLSAVLAVMYVRKGP